MPRHLLPAAFLLGVACSRPEAVSVTSEDHATEDDGDAFFDDSRVHQLKLDLSEEAVATLRRQDSRTAPREDVPARFTFDDEAREVETHLRGSIGSFRRFDEKPGFKLKFAERWHGLKGITLQNSVQDPSFTAADLAYSLYRERGMPARRMGLAQLTVNGTYFGIYVVAEEIDKTFVRRWFPDDASGNLYKCNVDLGLGGPCDFNDATHWEKETNDDDPDRSELDRIAEILKTDDADRAAQVGARFDLTNFRNFWALEDVVVHWDGYVQSPNNNNYYVYHAKTADKFYMIPSGMDQTFDRTDFGPLAERSVVAPLLKGDPSADDSHSGAIRRVMAGWNRDALQAKVDRGTALVAAAIRAAPRPVDDWFEFRLKQSRLDLAVAERPAGMAVRACTNGSTPVASYMTGGFRFLVGAEAPSGWDRPAFDDAAWPVARGALGSGNDCNLLPAESWPGLTTAYTRLKITLPAPDTLCSVKLAFAVDDVVEAVTFNGVSILPRPFENNRCAANDTVVLYPPRSLWREGENVVAIRIRDHGGDAYFDQRASYKLK